MSVNELWQELINGDYFNEQELQLITSINGYSKETLEDCIYARYGYKTFEDLKEEY